MKKNYKNKASYLTILLFMIVLSNQYLNAQTMTANNNWTVPTMLIDGVTASGYEFGGGIPCWAVFDYTSTVTNPVKWNSYTITAASNLDQSATGWEIAASNDNNSWTVLDTHTGVVWATTTEAKTYTFTNSTAYSYYRLKITSSIVGWGAFVGELTFSSTGGTTGLNVIKNNTMILSTDNAKSELIINFNKEVSNEQISVFDIKGSRVLNALINSKTTVLDIQNLRNGVYVVKSSQGTARFIK